MHQVGNLQRLYRNARATGHKKASYNVVCSELEFKI
jgi:hypothetical protein